jgi:thiol-disulfide isomerase/thioredoxin
MIIKVNNPLQLLDILKDKEPHLLDFSAEWCGPCRCLKPHLIKMAEGEDGLRVYLIDADLAPNITRRFRVTGLPTLVWRVHGKRNKRQVGLTDEAIPKQLRKLCGLFQTKGASK